MQIKNETTINFQKTKKETSERGRFLFRRFDDRLLKPFLLSKISERMAVPVVQNQRMPFVLIRCEFRR